MDIYFLFTLVVGLIMTIASIMAVFEAKKKNKPVTMAYILYNWYSPSYIIYYLV